MINYPESEAKLRRQRTREAIDLAMKGRWEEAVAANRSVIDVFPNDINAHNRLGKALTELGRYDEAMEAYGRALEIDRNNSIAQKNLRRLSLLRDADPTPAGGTRRALPELFVEESGKAGVAALDKLASGDVLARAAAGDQVYLRPRGQGLVVENTAGEYLGQVDPKIGVRLSKLIEGGNGYTAAIARAADDDVKVIIKEVYQHPSQVGVPSFPAQQMSGFKAYIKDSILKYELEDEEAIDDRHFHLEWSEEPAAEGAETSSLTESVDDSNGSGHALLDHDESE